MKLKYLFAILLVLLITCRVQGQAVDLVKQAILAEEFARFKHESGFRGIFVSDREAQSRIEVIVGNYRNITISLDLDDTELTRIFDDIVARTMPILQTQEIPVFESVRRDRGTISAIYRQHANGYKVQILGYLDIVYYTGRGYFELTDYTWAIDNIPIEPKLSSADAVAIWKVLLQKHFQTAVEEEEPSTNIAYYPGYQAEYRDPNVDLSWLVQGQNHFCIINAVTGEVKLMGQLPMRHRTRPSVMHFFN